MLNNRKQSSASFLRRGRKRQVRRLLLESLERRECMAVDFTFSGGILSVNGDEGPNVIEIFQPRDRVVEVNGDGERRTFEGVDAVFVATLGGDDVATYSKPKEIVVVASKSKYDMGAGNDEVRIYDGGATRKPAIFNTVMDVNVDLGTGIDDFQMDIRHTDSVNLVLMADDGSDKILIEMVVVDASKVRHPDFIWYPRGVTAAIDLGGGNNEFSFLTEGVDNVELDLSDGDGLDEPMTMVAARFREAAANNQPSTTPNRSPNVTNFTFLRDAVSNSAQEGGMWHPRAVASAGYA